MVTKQTGRRWNKLSVLYFLHSSYFVLFVSWFLFVFLSLIPSPVWYHFLQVCACHFLRPLPPSAPPLLFALSSFAPLKSSSNLIALLSPSFPVSIYLLCIPFHVSPFFSVFLYSSLSGTPSFLFSPKPLISLLHLALPWLADCLFRAPFITERHFYNHSLSWALYHGIIFLPNPHFSLLFHPSLCRTLRPSCLHFILPSFALSLLPKMNL